MNFSNTIKTTKLLAILFISALTFTACSEDDHDDHGHEEELITTVNYTLTNGNDVTTLTFSDPDGEGGNDPTYSVSNNLEANTSYVGQIELLNETESPAEDITDEIREEDDEHEFFYTTSVSGLTVEKTDTDGNDNPLGLITSLKTGDAGTGTLTIILIHEPTKPNDGTFAGAGGSTDINVSFNITVE